MAKLIRIARTLARSAVNGPGERHVIWVQGCPLRCPGCWNADTWPASGGHLVTTEQLWEGLQDATRETPEIEGVTLSGGEPFAQAEALLPLVKHIRAAGLSVMAFSGFEWAELTRVPVRRALLARCDVVVSGRYMATKRSLHLPWRGSSNQRIHFLSGRYGRNDIPLENGCEWHLDGGGAVLTGFPGDDVLSFLGYADEPPCKVETSSLALPLSQTASRPVGRLPLLKHHSVDC